MVFTDSPEYAARVLGVPAGAWLPADPDPATERLLQAFLRPPVWALDRPGAGPFPWVLITETADQSNYDRLIELVRDGHPLPDRLACLAGSGRGFHGFKDRSWSAVEGNLHLSVYLAPGRPVERFEVAFMALAAVSVVDAIDRVPGLERRAGIRWVNDIVLDGAKAGGVLAYTHAQHTTVNAAVLGVGLNVETRPPVEPTPFVPAVTALREHVVAGSPRLAELLPLVLDALDENYRALLTRGHRPLAERYRARSVLVGRHVLICDERSDTEPRVLDRGTVVRVGEGLELYLEGRVAPVTRGQIIVADEAERGGE